MSFSELRSIPKEASAPVHILQDAFCIIGRGAAKEGLHVLVPELWQVMDLDAAINQALLQLVSAAAECNPPQAC